MGLNNANETEGKNIQNSCKTTDNVWSRDRGTEIERGRDDRETRDETVEMYGGDITEREAET